MQNTTTKEIVITGLSIAMVFVATMFINIRLPFGQGGLIHLGNVPLFLVAIIFGLLTKYVYKNAGNNIYTLSGYFYFATLAIYSIRGDLSYVLAGLAKQIVLVLIIIKYIDKYVTKKSFRFNKQ